MNEEELAVSENSVEEPQSDNQEQQTLLNLNPQEEPAQSDEPDAMPHMQNEEDADEPIDWGDRPEWVPGQFWSDDEGPDVEGVFKSYNELRAKMSQGLHKAPKDGAYAMDVMSDSGIAEDDEMATGYLDLAKKHGISQDAFNEFASLYFNSVGDAEEIAAVSVQDERAKIGRNADRIISETEQWLVKMGSSGVISSEETEALANASTNGHFITAMNKIRQSYNEAPIPAIDLQEGATVSRQELDDMVGDPRYGVDMAFTRNVEQEFLKAFGEA
jgi:hypothetical protein